MSRAKFQSWSQPIEPAQLLDIEVAGSSVTLLVASALPPLSQEDLQVAIEEAVGYDFDVEVQWVKALPQ